MNTAVHGARLAASDFLPADGYGAAPGERGLYGDRLCLM
jgi:hypothetical protein